MNINLPENGIVLPSMTVRRQLIYLLCSDAQDDLRLLSALEEHLSILTRHDPGIQVFHTGLLRMGEHRSVCRQYLQEAHVVLVLLSSHFMKFGSTAYELFGDEVIPRHKRGELHLLPVLLRPMDLTDSYFEGRRLLCEEKGLAGLTGDQSKQEIYVELTRQVRALLASKPANVGQDLIPNADTEREENDDDESLERVLRRRLPLQDREVLECDRTRQWQDMEAAAGRPGHEVLLLPGGSTQGHPFFLMRARLCLPIFPPQRHPPSAIGLAHYHPKSGYDSDYRAALAHALRSSEGSLPSTLRRRLTRSTLVLVHELHHGGKDEDDDALVECLTRWLPELLAQVGPVPHGLKCVQGLSYYEAPALSRALARLIGVPQKATQRHRIERLCRRILKAPHRSMPVMLLDPLAPIQRSDIIEFCQKRLLLPDSEHERFLAMVTSDAETSETILKMIECNFYKFRKWAGQDLPQLKDDRR